MSWVTKAGNSDGKRLLYKRNHFISHEGRLSIPTTEARTQVTYHAIFLRCESVAFHNVA